MTTYLLSMYQPQDGVPEPAVLEAIMDDVGAVRMAMQEAGIWVFAGGLFPTSTATVVRVGAPGTQALITDGPFIEAREHIGGITVVDVEDLDAALGWAERLCIASTLPIEVRPFRG